MSNIIIYHRVSSQFFFFFWSSSYFHPLYFSMCNTLFSIFSLFYLVIAVLLATTLMPELRIMLLATSDDNGLLISTWVGVRSILRYNIMLQNQCMRGYFQKPLIMHYKQKLAVVILNDKLLDKNKAACKSYFNSHFSNLPRWQNQNQLISCMSTILSFAWFYIMSPKNN